MVGLSATLLLFGMRLDFLTVFNFQISSQRQDHAKLFRTLEGGFLRGISKGSCRERRSERLVLSTIFPNGH